MARPIDINKLLATKSKKENITGNEVIRKPISSRNSTIISTSSNQASYPGDYENLQFKPKKRIAIDSGEMPYQNKDSNVSNHIPKKRKFQFEWEEEEDSSINYKPIVSVEYNRLFKNINSSELDTLERAYIGKHWSEKSWEEMTDRDWRIFREDFNISTKGSNAEQPLRYWNEKGLMPDIVLDIIKKELKFEEPSAIQRVAIPNISSKKTPKRDFLGIASTGSGKTLAFVLPIICSLIKSSPRIPLLKIKNGPKALILAPTRELAQQCQQEASNILKYIFERDPSLNFNSVSVIGGHSIQEQLQDLRNGADILIATPGRLIDVLESHMTVFSDLDFLVLDEADRMVDLGFEDQLLTILTHIQKASTILNIQTIMFTATMSPKIEKIANRYLKKPVYATIGNATSTEPQIEQIVDYAANEDVKFKKLLEYVSNFPSPIIIFINYKRTADWLVDKFYQETTFRVTTIHGSKSQEQREQALNNLRSGKAHILIATNVAARGIDIPNVSLVVNYQMPLKFEDYIHRIGRTGRASQKGTAVTLLGNEEDSQIIEELYRYMKEHDVTKSNNFPNSILKLYDLVNHTDMRDNIIY
ncbi:hypothetical protein TBLA_0D02800 [Henningerozyma blattae CBS 6284]|uniref:RNA helicase n=1 Tax=Henningerozyma blattae (strain ATCC 34711 / CBS 6284 / DSM 70876 / NBRC 10599 / NRRL Y-10934 / UCD 77-7) TaxID=1071380 RepID=I2H329_HENB6|nr:hypothetical protein TBLA_0D02800 [Tetrapisispora blattae CBS 6284]CCH60781.1 hypothetical protein TBLA_0D02800 [Tetrapisispora blattae CBS 6284]